MKVLRFQQNFMRSYQELLMFQIIQDMYVVLPIWMLMTTTKIIVLTNLENIQSDVTENPLLQHLIMISYQSFSKLVKLYLSQMMDGPGLLR